MMCGQVGVLPREWPGMTIEATAPLSLTSFALSLLLVFRTNSSYARWQEARCIWGGITNRSRDIVQQVIRQCRTYVSQILPCHRFAQYSALCNQLVMVVACVYLTLTRHHKKGNVILCNRWGLAIRDWSSTVRLRLSDAVL